MTFAPADRIHTSTKPDLVMEDVDWKTHGNGIFKPPGLWYGFGDSWIDWCEAEGFHTGEKADRYAFKLDLNVGVILQLHSVEDIDLFTKKYLTPIPVVGWPKHLDPLAKIDWQQVAQLWAGIEINPYQYERRMTRHTFWYYPWDCASGVVWRSSAVSSITRVPWKEKKEK
jgi:hypothetical protein